MLSACPDSTDGRTWLKVLIGSFSPTAPTPPLSPSSISYAARTFQGVALNSHLASDNYFYLNCVAVGGSGGGAGNGMPLPARCLSELRPTAQSPSPRSTLLVMTKHAPGVMQGKFSRACCPEYLTPQGFSALNAGGRLEALHVVSGFFLPTLCARTYTKGAREAFVRVCNCGGLAIPWRPAAGACPDPLVSESANPQSF